jgi:hypothetical protein
LDVIRDVDPDMLAALASGRFHLGMMARIQWVDTTIRVHSGRGTLVWSLPPAPSEDWEGLGSQGLITLPPETIGGAMTEGRMILGGDEAALAEIHAQAEAARGGSVEVWLAALTKRGGNELIGNPCEIWRGQIGQVGEIEDHSSGEWRLQVAVEITSGRPQRTNALTMHSFTDQRRLDPSDYSMRWSLTAEAQTLSQVLK